MSEFSLSEINDRIAKESKFIEPLKSSIGEVIVGQEDLINKILIGSFHKDGNGWDDGLTPKLIKGPDIFIKTINEIKKKIGRDQFAVVLTAPARGYIKERLTKNSIEFFHFYPFIRR